MERQEQLTAISEYVSNIFKSDATGHDFYHMRRVAEMAAKIAVKEDADLFICQAAAWVHDIGDAKLTSSPNKDREELNEFLGSIGCTEEEIEKIISAVKDVSFSQGKIPNTLEGKIVQDADRLDALGAVGIARTFAYGGAKGQLIWNDYAKPGTSIQHFYDKLLTLKKLMNTSTSVKIAESRHRFMEEYLDQFFVEWDS